MNLLIQISYRFVFHTIFAVVVVLAWFWIPFWALSLFCQAYDGLQYLERVIPLTKLIEIVYFSFHVGKWTCGRACDLKVAFFSIWNSTTINNQKNERNTGGIKEM